MGFRQFGLVALLASSNAIGGAPEWAGSRACDRCHAAISRTYRETPMAKSSGEVSATAFEDDFSRPTFSDAQSRFLYTVRRATGGLALSMRKSDPEPFTVERALRYFIGSGTVARTFLIETGGFLYESPATYYGRTQSWNFSPGYAKYSYPFLTRAIAPGCIDCHATRIQPIPATQNGFRSPPFAEAGIGCERCHGPGALHVRTGKAKDIVNPIKLSTAARESVCAQCHLSGEARVERAGRSELDFLAGDILSDYSVAFVKDGPAPGRRFTSHVENLAQSACQRLGGSRLWCGTCHDPHSVPDPAGKVAWFRSKCQACHADGACTAGASLRAARNDDCVACHMPKTAVTDAEHVVSTDHSIPRKPGLSDRTVSGSGLVPFGGTPASSRDLGIANGIVALRDRNPLLSKRAFDLLVKAQTESPDEPQTLAYLADLYRTGGDDVRAAKLYERLLQVDPTQSAAPVALGGYAMEKRDYDRAIQLWNQALRISPALVLVRSNLAIALSRRGKRDEAMTVLEGALEFNPSFDAARALLNELRAGKTL